MRTKNEWLHDLVDSFVIVGVEIEERGRLVISGELNKNTEKEIDGDWFVKHGETYIIFDENDILSIEIRTNIGNAVRQTVLITVMIKGKGK